MESSGRNTGLYLFLLVKYIDSNYSIQKIEIDYKLK